MSQEQRSLTPHITESTSVAPDAADGSATQPAHIECDSADDASVASVVPSAGDTPAQVPPPGATAPPKRVFALGRLGFSYTSEARIDSFRQHMFDPKTNPSPDPHDAGQLLLYLQNNPWDSASVVWTLNFDLTPIYAIAVGGPFASHVADKLREFLGQQIRGEVERISVPGLMAGRVRLTTGEQLPLIYPELRGMYSWNTTELVKAVVGEEPAAEASQEAKQQHTAKREGIRRFLDRVYYDLRNLGQTSQERAINYAATNAFEIERIYESAMREDMEIETIDSESSPYCRIGSDCWDVKLTFFYPKRETQRVRKAYRFTVDVSDTVPVTVGPMHEWYIRG